MRIALLQPFIPHYRTDFIQGLIDHKKVEVYCYEDSNMALNQQFQLSSVSIKTIWSKHLGPFLVYNPIPLMRGEYDQMVLMLHYGHLTTWFMLFWNKLTGKRNILWGQGISVKRYLTERRTLPFFMKQMIALSDVIWLYTSAEVALWQAVFPNKHFVALNNTISDVDEIIDADPIPKESAKSSLGISQKRCLIFCARFGHPHRRTDVLMDLINMVDSSETGFIIVGGGEFKPNFSNFPHVYDFGAVYDRTKKDQLFAAADLYIQPGWVGLSVVEALAYGKPVITLNRSESTLQCVEYAYLLDGYNAFLCEDALAMHTVLKDLDDLKLAQLQSNCQKYVSEHLTMTRMISQAVNSLEQ